MNMGVPFSEVVPGEIPSDDEIRQFNPDIDAIFELIREHAQIGFRQRGHAPGPKRNESAW